MFCGIDWAKKHLDFCIEDSRGDILKRGRIDNSEKGFNSLLKEFARLEIESEVAVSIESPHQRVVDFLIARGVSVYPVNPKAVFDYRRSRFPSGSKSDTADAQLLADYLREHHKYLRVWQISEPSLRKLKILVDDRDKLVQHKVRLRNQLESTLEEYYPQALSAFSNLTTKTALSFLSQFPTFSSTQQISQQEWQEFLDSCRCFHPSARKRFKKAMKLPPIEISPVVVEAKSLFVTAIVQQLNIIVLRLKEYKKEISNLLSRFDDGDRFRSFPGIDVIIAAKLLTSIGIDRNRFSSANELQSFYGTAPYTRGSGQRVSVHFRVKCNKKMRTALEQMARASIRCSKWAKNYYDKKRNEGKDGHHALRCLANSWLKIIFAVWRDKTYYDENIHLASITQHQLSQPS